MNEVFQTNDCHYDLMNPRILPADMRCLWEISIRSPLRETPRRPLEISQKYDVLFVSKYFFGNLRELLQCFSFGILSRTIFERLKCVIFGRLKYVSFGRLKSVIFGRLKCVIFGRLKHLIFVILKYFNFREIELCHPWRLKYVIFEILQYFTFREIEICLFGRLSLQFSRD